MAKITFTIPDKKVAIIVEAFRNFPVIPGITPEDSNSDVIKKVIRNFVVSRINEYVSRKTLAEVRATIVLEDNTLIT